LTCVTQRKPKEEYSDQKTLSQICNLALIVQRIGRRGGSTWRTHMIRIPQWIGRSNEARVGLARVATALAFMSIGALAVGALAVGRLAIGKLVLKTGQIDRLSIDELQVNVLRIREQIIENP
jgi:hypothetical protein